MAKIIANPREIEPGKFVAALANQLKSIDEMKAPGWSAYVKTSPSKMRPPENNDWWYTRAASILKQVYKQGIVGVERLKTKYGSRQKRGMAPEKFRKAGGKIIRVILQQAEKAGLIEKIKDTKAKAGRKLTKKGKELLEKVAQDLQTHEISKFRDTKNA